MDHLASPKPSSSKPLKLVSLIAVASLAACTSNPMRSYDSEMKDSLNQAKTGQIEAALAILEKNAPTQKDLLYYLEKGELLRSAGRHDSGREAWLAADEMVRAWEEEAKTNPQKLLGDIGSVLINDKTRRYDGLDYEKVMLSVRLAMNHITLGEWDKARLEVKKMHEREAVIADLRQKELDDLKQKAEEKNVKASSIKELKGYPVETLEDPAAISLQNSYQSAIGHYLAGFVYEALGEGSLAAPGYRKAIELQPKVKALESGLADLDSRLKRAQPGEADVLFVVESGTVPGLKSHTIPLPVPLGGRAGLQLVPTSFPTIPEQKFKAPGSMRVNGREIPLAQVTNFDAMARRSLRDAMPGIILRSTIRTITKGIAQKAASEKGGAIGGLLMMAVNFATESSDERMWRSLPHSIGIYRATLPYGEYRIDLPGTPTQVIQIKGRHALVNLKQVGGVVYASQGQTAPEILVAKSPPPSPAPETSVAQPSAKPSVPLGKGKPTAKKAARSKEM